MIYDLTREWDVTRIKARVMAMIRQGKTVELTDKSRRSGNQNRYLHLILGVVAMETGHPLEYVKAQYFKLLCNRDLFLVERDDPLAGRVTELRSSADLTKEEMATAIDRYVNWATQQGWRIPDPDDLRLLQSVEYEMSKQKQWL
jgi:hypothetical protein